MASEGLNSRGRCPPLPPRLSSGNSLQAPAEGPPSYESVRQQHKAFEKATASPTFGAGTPLMHSDPRSSSQDSLVPDVDRQDQKRTLLLVYIHGFMGNETSFRSFPAHVHNLLVVLIGESHVVHTKIYPRYRSRGRIVNARDDFSRWLEPHVGSTTDVILLGHSMGGLLAAEVALMPAPRTASTTSPLNHRILGTINFDVPFLGMHTGVVTSGLASIFKSGEEVDDKWEHQQQESSGDGGTQSNVNSNPSRMDTLWGKIDPNFNPRFSNDVALPVRKGWQNAWHFVNKHSTDLVHSTKKLISSHMEFGGAMANYNELKVRYARIRALEEEDGQVRKTVVDWGVPPRVRFVNYYTVSTGRPKKSHSPLRRLSPSPQGSRSSSRASVSRISLHRLGSHNADPNRPSTLGRLSSSDVGNKVEGEPRKLSNQEDWDHAMASLQINGAANGQSGKQSVAAQEEQTLPHLPPTPPALGDLSYIQDEKIRQIVIDDHAKAVEKHNEAIKERERLAQSCKSMDKQQISSSSPRSETLNSEQPGPEKQDSELTHSEKEALRLEKEQRRMQDEARRLRGEAEPDVAIRHSSETIPLIESRTPSMPASTVESVSTYDSSLLTPRQSIDSTVTSGSKKAKKDRKFCNLPPKDNNGKRDPCWVSVFMKDVDEVGAHCGLFFVDERYERLVGEVAERVEQWVLEDNNISPLRGESLQLYKEIGSMG